MQIHLFAKLTLDAPLAEWEKQLVDETSRHLEGPFPCLPYWDVSSSLQNRRNRAGHPYEFVSFPLKPPAPGRRNPIHARPAAKVRLAPFGADPAIYEQSLQRGIQ
jgi:hypothetical protein